MISEEFKLFKKLLLQFENESLHFPIRLSNPLLVKIEFVLDCMNYSEQDIEKRIHLLILNMQEKSKNENFTNAFLMYSLIKYIDECFDYYVANTTELINASKITYDEIDQRNQNEYWLTSWRPEMILSEENLMVIMNKNKALWSNITNDLKVHLFNLVFMPPFSDIGKSWDFLRETV